METTILKELKEDKRKPCVSIIIPTHNKSHERTTDEFIMSNAIQKATVLLHFKYGRFGSNNDKVIENLQKITKDIDYVHNDKGLGIFVSPDIARAVKFPFEVKEKIIVGESFEVRDMLFLAEYLLDYYVLAINEKGVRLFKGNGEKLVEVKDNNFPVKFQDDFEYERTSLGSSYGFSLKSTEKDKSVIAEQRLIANFKKIDKKLSAFLLKDTPLLLAGVSKEIGYFMKITSNEKFIVGKIKGNYIRNSIDQVGALAFEQIKLHFDNVAKTLLANLDIAIGKKLAAIGLEEVWYSSKEGKGLILLVEKDHARPGFITGDKLNLVKPTSGKPHKIITDVVDDVMETVLKKNGKVVILQNGMLSEYQGIALIERYR